MKKRGWCAALFLATELTVVTTTSNCLVMPEKRCACGSTGPFWKNRAKEDGLCTSCVACMQKTAKAWRKNNPEKMKASKALCRAVSLEEYRAAGREWHKKNPEKSRQNQRRALLKKYGLTLERWEAMFIEQGWCCALCKQPMSRGRGSEGAAVDHDHQTGRVRGLIHGSCNQALGLLRDSAEMCRQAAEYLEKHNEEAARMSAVPAAAAAE